MKIKEKQIKTLNYEIHLSQKELDLLDRFLSHKDKFIPLLKKCPICTPTNYKEMVALIEELYTKLLR